MMMGKIEQLPGDGPSIIQGWEHVGGARFGSGTRPTIEIKGIQVPVEMQSVGANFRKG